MKTYIDERPFEEIVQSVILDEKHTDFVEEVMDVLTRYDENYKYTANPYNGDHTLYDGDIVHLETRKKDLEKQKEMLEKMYNASFEKVVALEKEGEMDDEMDEDADGEEYDEDAYYETKGKSKQKSGMKPAEAAKKKKQQAISAKNFRTTMATMQQEILDLNKELTQITADLEKYRYYQEIAIKTVRTLRRVIEHYKIHRDVEFVRKGAYFAKDYSSKLIERYNKSR